MTQKKIIFIGALFLLVDLGISLFFFILKPNLDKSSQIPSLVQITPIPKKIIPAVTIPPAPEVINKVEVLPSIYQNKPSIEKFMYQGKINIRENAFVEKVLTAGKTYQLKLDSGHSQTVEINDNTYLGTAWYGLDANNNLADLRYEPAAIEKIKEITINTKVAIRYLEENQSNQTLDLLEFIILK